MKRKLRVLLAAISVLAAGQSGAKAALTPVLAGSETSLGKLLFLSDSMVDANHDDNRVDDAQDQVYDFPSTAVATLIIEIAGHKNANDFGIYDPTNPNEKFVIFDGPEGPSATKTVTFNSSTKEVTYYDVKTKTTATKTFGGTQFGFFLGYDGGSNDENYAYTLYSEPAKNGPANVSGTAQNADAGKEGRTSAETQGDRLVTFDNWTEVTINKIPVKSGGQKLFDRILAFEDLKTGSDYDYNDMVIGISMTVVPEPTTILAAGLLSLGFVTSLFLQWRSKRMAGDVQRFEP